MKSPTSFILLATAASMAITTANEYFTGDGTAYTLGDTSSGNCNMMSALDIATTDYAAINNDQWSGLQNCGRCAEVTCADSRCADQTKSVVVQILDRCPECKHGDLDLSPSVFKTLTGSHPSRYTVKWKFVDCPVAGNVNYCLKGGSNKHWTAIQPTNVATGITSLKINGKATKMLDGAYYYLLDGSGTVVADLSKVTVSLTDLNGVSMEDTMSLNAGSCTQGARQFPSSLTGSSSTTSTNTSFPTSSPTERPKKPSTTMAPTIVTPLTPISLTATPTQIQQTSAPVSAPKTTIMAPTATNARAFTDPTLTAQYLGSSNTTQTAQSSASGDDDVEKTQTLTTNPSTQQLSYYTEGEETQTPVEQAGMSSADGEDSLDAPATVAPHMISISSSDSNQSNSVTEKGESQTIQQESSVDCELEYSTASPSLPATPSTTTTTTSILPSQLSGSTSVGTPSITTQDSYSNEFDSSSQQSPEEVSGEDNTEVSTLTTMQQSGSTSENEKVQTTQQSLNSASTESDITKQELSFDNFVMVSASTGTANCPM